MKKKISELFKNRKFAAGFTAIALAAIIGGTALVQQSNDIPELPVYTDPVMETTIEDDEPPLAAAPTVTTKTSKKTSTKKVTLSKAATKTYTKTLPTTKKTSTNTSNTAAATVVTQTTVAKATKEKYTKKSKVKVVTTTTTTTVKTTTTAKVAATSVDVSDTTKVTTKQTVDVAQLAPSMDGKILNAYKTLGFTVTVDPSVSYSGYFNASTRSITLRSSDDTIYHELGHFVAFISGNTDKTSSFAAVYSQEKANYTGYNKAYVTQNSSEYFAESVRDYILNRGELQSTRPQTYAAINAAFAKITDAQVAKIKTVFSSVWG